jgi:hypothetical protein
MSTLSADRDSLVKVSKNRVVGSEAVGAVESVAEAAQHDAVQDGGLGGAVDLHADAAVALQRVGRVGWMLPVSRPGIAASLTAQKSWFVS